MLALLEIPDVRCRVAEAPEMRPPELADMVSAMGERLRLAYLEGAIPYLREHQPEIWATLASLDEDDSAAALEAYERVFLDGLLRYASAMTVRAA